MAFNLEKLYADDDFEVLRDSEKENLALGAFINFLINFFSVSCSAN